MQSQNALSVQQLIAVLIQAGSIESLNYNPAGPAPFALAGTRIDLTNGDMKSTALFVNGATGDLSVRGEITATALSVLDAADVERYFFGPQTLLGIDGYVLAYSDPDFDNATTEVGIFSTGTGGAPGNDVASSRVYATIGSIPIHAWAEAQVIESLQESSMSLQALAGAQAALLVVSRVGNPSEINLICDSLGGWTAFPFAANFGNPGAGFQVPQYRKVGDMVQVRGEFLTTGATGANPIIGTLPAGRRPPATTHYPVVCSSGGFLTFVQIGAAGGVLLATPGVGAGVQFAIDFAMPIST